MKIIRERSGLFSEMAMAGAVLNHMPSYQDLIARKDREHTLAFIKKEWPNKKREEGWETFREAIEAELKIVPRLVQQWRAMSEADKADFWLKVDFIEQQL